MNDDYESPTGYATRTGLSYGRLNPADIIDWDRVLDLAVDAYWRNSRNIQAA